MFCGILATTIHQGQSGVTTMCPGGEKIGNEFLPPAALSSGILKKYSSSVASRWTTAPINRWARATRE